MNGTTFPSNPCYLPIFQDNQYGGLERYTPIWRNFIHNCKYPNSRINMAFERIKDWNGRLINDVVIFDTEQDKMWFILNWS